MSSFSYPLFVDFFVCINDIIKRNFWCISRIITSIKTLVSETCPRRVGMNLANAVDNAHDQLVNVSPDKQADFLAESNLDN